MLPEHETQLIGILNGWQEKHDLRPSEMAIALLKMATHFSPGAKKQTVAAALVGVISGLSAENSKDNLDGCA